MRSDPEHPQIRRARAQVEGVRGAVASRLRELRMSARDLAACTGIDHSTISRFLSGETTNPTAETFVALLLWAAEPATPGVG